ncbi:hypothetical protein McpSp1_18030 [Methanocorpusculaceae archaeon Sp1]|uniref:DUF116 domain-containing protein n=1 Tax=Methanorbis furvi TaxID=3028299 RepID=A0AAE4MCF0_9EURY|nr:hypothetical protein [Methanocorpusculaceae archaeon Sp1]MDV0441372.1 hypothetical protein [Methanocorpusculaceae archaeon Ag1]
MPVTLPFSIFGHPYWDSLALMIGQIALLIFFVWLALVVITVLLFVVSIRKKHLYCPWLLRPAYLLLKGAVRTGCRMVGIDDTEITTVLIKLENDVNRDEFAAVPVKERAVFLPHCLRSAKCPAHLTPLGIKCLDCDRCGLGMATNALTDAGYLVFIVPGSTYIKRLLKRFHPRAMIGVGCLMEIKQFQEMARKIEMTAMGVVMKSDGCVETSLDWDELFEVASIGLPEPVVGRK